MAVVSYLISTNYVDTRTTIAKRNVNPNLQLQFILENPFKYIGNIFLTLYERIDFYISTFLGQKLGALNITVRQFDIWILGILILFAPFLEKNETMFNKKEKILMMCILCIVIVLILTGLYMGWTPVGDDIIDGVQGRYFIPVFILPLLCLINTEKYIKYKNTNILYVILILSINISAIISVIRHFLK